MSRRTWTYVCLLLGIAGLVYVAVALVVDELRTSQRQAHYLSDFARGLTFEEQPGASDAIRFPVHGPADTRFGYTWIPQLTTRLEARGFTREAQARQSPALMHWLDSGMYAPYHEKTTAGLQLLDCHGETLFARRYPEQQYAGFADIPPVLVNSLLFIENQSLLDPEFPERNPAVDWRRLARAALDLPLRAIDPENSTPGGSTLATQIEKFRHSAGGRTESVREKFRQMGSAAVRAYRDGPDTTLARQRIVTDYLNAVPLAARSPVGEILGIGEGLALWYGTPFEEANRELHALDMHAPTPRQGEIYKQMLSLVVSQRRPSYYLRRDTDELAAMTDSYLRLLAAADIISPALRDAALQAPLHKAPPPVPLAASSFVASKAVNQVRSELARLTGVASRYDLERFDLQAASTINGVLQARVAEALQAIRTPAGARSFGLYGKNLLREGDDPSRLNVSFTLYELDGDSSALRVQADTLDQPFDLNTGARLNLGSTAKLRTLVTYLEIIAELHSRYAALDDIGLHAQTPERDDALNRWAIDYLLRTRDRDLGAMLDAALERKYSDNDSELFLTGGGLQKFSNFESAKTGQMLSVRMGFRNSVNLVFIRLMRDIVRYETYRAVPEAAAILSGQAADARLAYLRQFADQEGAAYLTDFQRIYRGLPRAQRVARLLDRVKPVPTRLAVALRSADPALGVDDFARTLRARLPRQRLTDADVQTLYDKYAPERFSLNDRGYLSGIHPLELWLVAHLERYGDTSLDRLLQESKAVRQEVYNWLFKTSRTGAQNTRIRTLLEQAAFERIGKRWQRLGYPFDTLTPSYAASIGASGDRPAALAELASIILNDGRRPPVTAVETLDIGSDTPFATRFRFRPAPGEQLLVPEIASRVRNAMRDVVDNGTARALRPFFQKAAGSAGPPLVLAGKTGTGDHRHQSFSPSGALTASRAISRTANFVFTIGERFYGTVTIHVGEPYAARHSFTSGLAVRLLGGLAPDIVAALQPPDSGTRLACPRTPDSGPAVSMPVSMPASTPL